MYFQSTDKIVLTSYARHLWLLNEDRHDKDWENGVQSDWEGHRGFHDIEGVKDHIPDAVWRLVLQTQLQR